VDSSDKLIARTSSGLHVGLDIGCGENKRAGLIGIDFRKSVTPDVVADARMLPFRDELFNYAFSSHVIEHFSHREVAEALSEWVRVLRKGGTMEIRCPDLRARALLFFLKPSWRNVKDIYGGQSYVGDQHRCGFSYGLLKRSLEVHGICNVKRIIRGYKNIPFIPDCLHVKGVKR
jgi:SAM-dependent methyltransferase